MSQFATILPYIQAASAVLLIVSILLQRNNTDLGGAFGGNDNWSNAFHTRRGFEKTVFISTIVLSIIFVLTSLITLISETQI